MTDARSPGIAFREPDGVGLLVSLLPLGYAVAQRLDRIPRPVLGEQPGGRRLEEGARLPHVLQRCALNLQKNADLACRHRDVERLLLVLRNLLDSAFTLLPGAEIMLQVTPEYVTEAGIQVSFSVVYVEEGLQRPTGPAANTGMGVAVAKFMVGAMGGRLAAAAHPTIGDSLYAFTIEFPVRPAVPVPPRPKFVSLTALPVLVQPSPQVMLAQ